MHRISSKLVQILALSWVACFHTASAEDANDESKFWQAYGLQPAVKLLKQSPDSVVLRVAMRSRDESPRIAVFNITEKTAVFVTRKDNEVVQRELALTERQWNNISSMPSYVDIRSLPSVDPYEPNGLDGPDCLIEWISKGEVKTLHRSTPFAEKKIRKLPENNGATIANPFDSSEPKDLKFIKKDAGDERINVLILYAFTIAGTEPFM